MATWSTQASFREYQMTANGEMNVVERLATLLSTGQYSDVTVRVGKGNSTVTFKAHKLLLATASQPLHKIVSTGVKSFPGDNPILRFSDVDPKSFQHVLTYIYTDKLEISEVGEAIDLLKISKKWCLAPLIEKTISYLTKYLDDYAPNTPQAKNDLCNLLVATTDDTDTTDLNQKCWKVLLEKASEIIPCQGFLNLPEAALRKLLAHKDFVFKEQLILFEAIRDWGMNQVIQRSLTVNELQAVIGDLLQHVDFKSIQDLDFMSTVLPSECLSKADLIAFFMSRGMEIPRDFASSNNNESESSLMINGSVVEYEKACRFRRGHKIQAKEICQEHELRFRVDKKLRLLGVGFGFLFSNTDMGITLHCQGPWEVRQWSDIMQTYCRVTWEKMQTADVRLMFNEPVTIEANQSYKILVKVGRMSSGSSEVDLWGGSHGSPAKTHNGTEFFFLKAATDPTKEVDKELTECKPGLITDLYYQLCDGTESEPEVPKPVTTRRRRASPVLEETPIIQKPPSGEINKRSFYRQDSFSDSTDKVRTRPSMISIEEPNEPYNPAPYQRKYCASPEIKTYELPWQSSTRKSSNEEVRSSYLRPKTSYGSVGGIGSSSAVGASTSSYSGSNYSSPAGSRKSSNEESKWEIPRSRTTASDSTTGIRSRDSTLGSSYRRNEPSSYSSSVSSYARDPSPSSTSSIRQRDSSSSRASDYTPSTYSSRMRSRYGSSGLSTSGVSSTGSSTPSVGTGGYSSGIGSSSLGTGSSSTGTGSYSSGTGGYSSRIASSPSRVGSYSSRYGSSSSGVGASSTGTGSSSYNKSPSSDTGISGSTSASSRTGSGLSSSLSNKYSSGTSGLGSSTSRLGSSLSTSRFGTSSSSSSSPSYGVGRFGSGRSTIGSNYSGYVSRYGSYR